MKIAWTNRYSKESGFVKSIDYKNKHFNNTYFVEEAKNFPTRDSVNKAIDKLIEYGEGNDNDFNVID